jgi:hypothetical protein
MFVSNTNMRSFPLLAVELLALCGSAVSTTFSVMYTIVPRALLPAAVLFFLGAPFPLLFAICKCSSRSSSKSL